MQNWSRLSGRTTALTASVVVTLAVGLGTATVPMANAAGPAAKAKPSTAVSASDDKTAYDARKGGTPNEVAALQRSAAKASSRAATEKLRSSLGVQAVVDMDGLTKTPRQVARLDGYLTRPSGKSAAKVALGYVRSHLGALGLTSADLSTFRLRDDYVDIAGIHHLSWTQAAGGVPLFGNGLKAAVTKDGRLLSLGGSPVSGLRAPAAVSSKVSSASSAIAAARADVAEASTVAGPDDSARQVLFATPSGTRRAWEAITMSAARPMLTVVDAESGRVLYRRDLSSDAAGPNPIHTPVTAAMRSAVPPAAAPKVADKKGAKGLAFRYFPRHKPRGGFAQHINYSAKGWLKANAKLLSGNNTHTFADVNDDNKPGKKEEIRAKRDGTWNYRLKPFDLKHVSFCNNPYPCSWNPNKAFSWRTNRNQNAAQVFFFVNNWHDHLKAAPIGFTEAAGNFQKINRSGNGKGNDPVVANTDDGANTDNGLPDSGHVDNANMATPPDGRAPRMQMYLQHTPGTSYPDGDPFAPTNVGDEADTVYHEYTHGLSNRLVVDADGRSTLGGVQAGAMGEAWGDWYAMDYLVAHKLQADRTNRVDVVMFQYDGEGVFLDRTEPLDCPLEPNVNSDELCTGGATGHLGGYTYADYGHVIGAPEVHADGEIWAQTLWDLRRALGVKTTESLVTRGMELAAENPSFLDMRNAILLADEALNAGDNHDAIWQVFADRGMGFFAGSLGGDDTAPGADFSLPPVGSDTGTISGEVTDSATGEPIQGAVVTVAFQGSPIATNPSDTTDADGLYSLGPIPQGTYPKMTVSVAGYDEVRQAVTVDSATVTVNASLDRDWASAAGGASIDDFTGVDFTPFGCGPVNAIDQSDGFGWSTSADLVDGVAGPDTPKYIAVKLPNAVDISAITVNPTANCGDGLSASAGAYHVEVSTDGVTYTEVSSGEFVAADRGRANEVDLTGSVDGIEYVRYWIDAPMVLTDTDTYGEDACNSGGAFSGCDWEDTVEVEVYGAATTG